jgi:hypothetical protein
MHTNNAGYNENILYEQIQINTLLNLILLSRIRPGAISS